MSKKKKKDKYRLRVFVLSMMTVFLIGLLLTTVGTWLEGFRNVEETNKNDNFHIKQLEEERLYENKIAQYQDPEYFAKYIREKYLYSKKDEIIIRIED